jgi:hypothetical protein
MQLKIYDQSAIKESKKQPKSFLKLLQIKLKGSKQQYPISLKQLFVFSE